MNTLQSPIVKKHSSHRTHCSQVIANIRIEYVYHVEVHNVGVVKSPSSCAATREQNGILLSSFDAVPRLSLPKLGTTTVR